MQGNTFFKLVESERIEDSTKKKVTWTDQKLFDEKLMSSFSDGPASFNADGNLMVYSRCFDQKTSKKNPSKNGLYFLDNLNGSWGNIREFDYNDPAANTIEPSLNKDATIMYFSSDRDGGFGGFDLYVSRFVNGKWTAPENLGPRVNTAENEFYPFIHSSGRLYFSRGYEKKPGGYDLYYTESYNGKWISPVKLPPPFNSGRNDYTYYADDDFQTGFFTSDSRGSKDIYTFSSSFPKFDVSQQQRENNYCFVFFEENTVELDSNLYQYEWDLGDNTKVRAVEAKHCFAGPGDYKVSLNIIDKLTKEVLFSQAEYDMNLEKIVQAYITCPDTIKKETPQQFSGQDSYFKDVKPGEYYWDFGDNNKGIGASISHTYLNAGTYTIKLGVIEDNPDAEEPLKFCSYKTIVVTEN